MEKGYLIASVGPLLWRTERAEEQEGLVGQNLLTSCKQNKRELPVDVVKGSGPAGVVL